MQTKSTTRWLALLLCMITVLSLFMPSVSAAESSGHQDGVTDLIRSIIPDEGIRD